MKTSITSGQLITFLTLLGQKGVTPEEFQKRLESGHLADLFHSSAILGKRNDFRRNLGLFPEPKIIKECDGGLLVIEIPTIADVEVERFLKENRFVPVTGEEVEGFAKTNTIPSPKLKGYDHPSPILAINCGYPGRCAMRAIIDGLVVARGGESWYYEGLYFLVKKIK